MFLYYSRTNYISLLHKDDEVTDFFSGGFKKLMRKHSCFKNLTSQYGFFVHMSIELGT